MVSKGVKVTIAGSIVNFSIGIIYAWSVFAGGLSSELGWSRSEAMLPYTFELMVFAIAMIFGGRFQDRVGPRRGIALCGLFIGLSLILCGISAHPIGVALAFGLGFGTAAAFGHSAVTPAVIKWFPPARRGLVTGIVLMSLGAAPLVWAPLINFLMARLGIINTFIVCGVFLFVTITGASRAMEIPEQQEYIFGTAPGSDYDDRSWQVIVRRPAFRILWLMIGLTSGVGLMFVGQLVQIAELNYQVTWGYLLVSLFALTNALGRLFGGVLCDKIGYINNMRNSLIMMSLAMFFFLSGWGWPFLVLATAFLGLSYGSLYTSFPTVVSRFFGLKNFGINYGMVFTAVAFLGSLAPVTSAYFSDLAQSYYPAYMMGLFASVVSLLLVAQLSKSAELSG